MCSPKPMSTGARRPRGPRAAHGGGQRGRADRRHTPGGAVSCCIWLAIVHWRSGAWVAWVNQPRRAGRTLGSLTARQGPRSKLDCAGDCRGGVPCMCLASCPRAGVRPRTATASTLATCETALSAARRSTSSRHTRSLLFVDVSGLMTRPCLRASCWMLLSTTAPRIMMPVRMGHSPRGTNPQ